MAMRECNTSRAVLFVMYCETQCENGRILGGQEVKLFAMLVSIWSFEYCLYKLFLTQEDELWI